MLVNSSGSPGAGAQERAAGALPPMYRPSNHLHESREFEYCHTAALLHYLVCE
jgi:hypothetical protein